MSYWEHPFWTSEDSFGHVWSRDRQDPVLVVLGSGFDPRAVVFLERLLQETTRRVDVLKVELPAAATVSDVRHMASENKRLVTELLAAREGAEYQLALPNVQDRGSIGRIVSRNFQQEGFLERYDEIVVEISAMPRSVFFPLIRGILECAHSPPEAGDYWGGDLHVAVCENPEADENIVQEGASPMAPIGGFAGPVAGAAATTIWVPVLGEGALPRVEQLYRSLGPDEVCPVLPWPAREPRRADSLVLEYRELLFDGIRLEARNLIHADERNPFDLYRTLGRLWERYRHALAPLGPVEMVLSSHSSKLLSIGVLLTAYEYGLAVQHVSPGTYGWGGAASYDGSRNEIFDLWLSGEPYR